MILIKPGTMSQRLDLQATLKARHEGIQASIDKEIAKRKARGVPLNDQIDWAQIQALANDENETIRDYLPDGLEPLDPFEPIDNLDGLEFECEVLSRKDVIAFKARMSYDPAERIDLIEEVLTKAKFKLVGIEDLSKNAVDVSPEDISNLGLSEVCFMAWDTVQELDPKSFGHSG